MIVRRLFLATCTCMALFVIAAPASASGTPESLAAVCLKLKNPSLGPVPAALLQVCHPETAGKVESKPPSPSLVDQGPILLQEASTDTMNATSVAGIATLTPFGGLGTDPGDFPADVELLPGDSIHAFQLSTLGVVSRMDYTGAVTPLPANLPPAGEGWTDMAVDPTSGIVYASSAVCGTSSRLSTVVLTAGTSASVGTITNSTCIVGIAFTNAGSLYGYDIVSDNLLSINKVTGAGAIVGPIGFDANFGQAMDCDPSSGTCYLFALNNTTGQAELRSVDLTTGATTLVGVIGATSPGAGAQAAGAVFGTIGTCTADADCNDGDLCNGLETCVNNLCTAGTPIDCDDGLFCTLDVCDPPTGACSHPPNPCNDDDPCTVDTCDNTNGCSNQNVCLQVCNTGAIAINDASSGTPYPSIINVSGAGAVASVSAVQLQGIQHTFPDDVDMLLVGPGGQNAIIMSDVGGGTPVVGVNLRLSDAAANPIPDGGPLASGTFKPTNVDAVDTFPAPAPVPSGGSALSVFSGLNPNGNWRLYVVDDAGIDSGTVAGGWCLNILVTNCTTNADCNDNNVCNGTETCNNGQCVLGTPVNCDDGLFCTLDTCNPANGACSYSPNPCSDGDACTEDTCDNATGCGHVNRCQQFCSTGAISIRDTTTALPYPSTISVAGLGSPAVLGTVQLQGLTHTFPDDIDMLLVGPAGQNAKIMSDVGGGGDVVGINLTLADGAATALPDGGPLATGTFRPNNVDTTDTFPAPAPAQSGSVALSTFDGTNPNGNWQLYIVDDAGGDTGSLTQWCVNIRPLCSGAPAALGNNLRASKSGTVATIQWTDVGGPFNVYRGTHMAAQAWYNHTCLQSGVVGNSVNDAALSAPFETYYYLVTRKTICGESIPGSDSTGAAIPNASPCP